MYLDLMYFNTQSSSTDSHRCYDDSSAFPFLFCFVCLLVVFTYKYRHIPQTLHVYVCIGLKIQIMPEPNSKYGREEQLQHPIMLPMYSTYGHVSMFLRHALKKVKLSFNRSNNNPSSVVQDSVVNITKSYNLSVYSKESLF